MVFTHPGGWVCHQSDIQRVELIRERKRRDWGTGSEACGNLFRSRRLAGLEISLNSQKSECADSGSTAFIANL
jgi:hypothetical protein